MCKKDKRSKKQNIKAIQRSIRKFGDSDGKRSEILKELKRAGHRGACMGERTILFN